MFLDLGISLKLTDEQFVEEMAKRREVLDLGVNDHVIGCPLCTAAIPLLPELEEEEEPAAVSEVEASSAEELLGTWTLPLESPQGAFNMTLEFSEGADGMLAALVDTPLGDPQSAQTISRSDDALVLGFTLSALGQSLPVTLTLTPAGDSGEVLNAEVDLGALGALSGTATKEQ
jgi:hypothetical protein